MRYWLSGLALLILILVGSSFAQEKRPIDSGVTIRSNVREVVLDVIVRDSHGKQVKNLQPGELQVYEDGVRQNVKSFRFVPGHEMVQQEPVEAVKQPAAPAPPRAANPLPALNLVCMVFHNLDPYTRQFAIDAAEQFLKNNLPPNTWVAVFNLGASLTVLHEFTTNRDEVIQAASRAFTGGGVSFTRSADAVLSSTPTMVTITESAAPTGPGGAPVQTAMVISGGELNTQANADASVSTGTAAGILRGDEVAEQRLFGHIEGMRETDQILAMVEQLKGLPGHKTVLLFSTGLALTGDAVRFESMVDKANQAGVTIDAIDVNGLTQNSSVLASTGNLKHAADLSSQQGLRNASPAQMMERMRQDDYVMQAVRTANHQASLRGLAEGTGGFLIANTNDLRKPFEHVIEDIDAHYEVAYHPASEVFDGKLRRIEVKVARAGLTVDTRPGYYAMPEMEPLKGYESVALAVLNAAPQPHAFDYRAAAYQFRSQPDASQYDVAFEVPGGSLTATPEPDKNSFRMHASLLALVKNDKGEVVEKLSKDLPYEFTNDKLDAVKADTMTATFPVTLPPGEYTVSTAVVDMAGYRASTNSIHIDSRAGKGIGLSSVVLVRRVDAISGTGDASDPFQYQGKRLVPEVGSTLRKDSQPYVYFVVYPDKAAAAKPKIEVQFSVNGNVLAKQAAELPPRMLPAQFP